MKKNKYLLKILKLENPDLPLNHLKFDNWCFYIFRFFFIK